jgi:hypothetical protein
VQPRCDQQLHAGEAEHADLQVAQLLQHIFEHEVQRTEAEDREQSCTG